MSDRVCCRRVVRFRVRVTRGGWRFLNDRAGGATPVSKDKSLILNDDSSKKTDPYGELKVFSGSSGQILGRTICDFLRMDVASSEIHVFSEGNVFVRVLENVRGRDVFIVQGTDYPVNDNFVELLFWIDAFKRASATQVTAVIPYFSYAKGDKKDEPRVSIRRGSAPTASRPPAPIAC